MPLSNLYFWDALVFGTLGVELLLLYAVPSVRKIGFSPTWFIVDIGVRQLRYSWREVHQITRTHRARYGSSRVSSVTHTRVLVGDGLRLSSYALTSLQGDRLARFTRIP
jgi:hypothetical protein